MVILDLIEFAIFLIKGLGIVIAVLMVLLFITALFPGLPKR